jgi:hypothetical protein
VGSGGNEKQTNSITLIDYILMMVEEFFKSKNTVPTTNSNVSVIAPYDFDNDGDVDVL